MEDKMDERYKLQGFDNFGDLTENGGGAPAAGAPAAGGAFATLSSTPGMGEPVYATATKAGSGDVPNLPAKKKKSKKRVKSFTQFTNHNK
jgi:hypothetical protein